MCEKCKNYDNWCGGEKMGCEKCGHSKKYKQEKGKKC